MVNAHGPPPVTLLRHHAVLSRLTPASEVPH